MRSTTFTVLASAALLCAACSSIERSRDLSNPKVSATTLAQQVCSNCHGMDGNAVSPNFPNLAAQSESYVLAQLSSFKSHGRHDPAGFEYMWGLSRSLTEDQINLNPAFTPFPAGRVGV
jgi:cytochrome c553